MTIFLLSIGCFILAFVGSMARKSYYAVPVRELKRRAKQHDSLAERLYTVVAYDTSLRALLWIYIAVSTAAGVILLAHSLPWWLSFVLIIVVLWVFYSWLPASRVSRSSIRLGIVVAPALQWILRKSYPLINRPAELLEKRYGASPHTGLYEHSDLLKLIQKQAAQADNRITNEELEIIIHALSFGERTVGQVMVGRKQFKTVLASDTVGPVVIDELHKSQQAFALVKQTPKGPVIATINVEQLGLNSTGKVQDYMDGSVYYLHEQDSLSEALHAIFVTNHPVFIVINSHEEFVGVLSLQTIVYELLGNIPGDEFDQYTTVAAIAARHTPPSELSDEPQKTTESLETDEFEVKVIE